MRKWHVRRARREAMVALDTTLTQAQIAQGVVRRAISENGVHQAAPPAELRRRVANLATGTYVSDILGGQDSALYRWPDRSSEAVRVYIQQTSSVLAWDRGYPELAREVFAEWSEAGFPVRFTFVYDSASADMTIHWRDRFAPEDGQRVGVTERSQTSAFLISKAHIAIATRDSAGRNLSPTVVGGILRHEVGHALGLNHANDPTSVMYREAATATISASDRATLRLLYLVPAGSLKD
jgi:hypothetical protein